MAAYRTLAQAADMTQDELLPGIINTLVTANQTLAWQEIHVTDRPAIKMNREVSSGTAAVVTCASTLTSEAIETTPQTFDMHTYARQFEVCSRVEGMANSFTDQFSAELRGAVKAMGYKLAEDMVSGTGTGEIYGLDALYAGTAVDATAGLTLDMLDEALDQLDTTSDKVAFVGSKATIRAIRRELREAGSLEYMSLADDRMRVPSYLGIPALINDNVGAGDIYVVDYSSENGGVGLAISQAGGSIDGLFDLVNGGRVENTIRDFYQVLGDFAQFVKNPGTLGKIENAS